MRRRLRVPIVMALGLLVALAAAAAFSSAEVSFRSAERDGARVAEVLIGERPVIVVRTSAAGYTPLERAEIVANRLRTAMASEIQAEDVKVGSVPSGQGLYIRDQLVVAVYQSEADAHGATPAALAGLWRDNILLALGYEVPEESAPPAAEPAPQEGAEASPEEGSEAAPGAQEAPAGGAAEEAAAAAATEAKPEEVDWTGTAQKWVPIFSLELEGARVGMAQVAGPTDQIDQVKGVYQLRLDFKSIGRVYAYVPVSTISTKLNRVQGVSVWALADIKVLGF
ncbi:MAG: hypothetical protein MUQ65_13090 [Armatimonadetes bacterium]|nr:hypothetical protein [Armatimonadota bacterium]